MLIGCLAQGLAAAQQRLEAELFYEAALRNLRKCQVQEQHQAAFAQLPAWNTSMGVLQAAVQMPPNVQPQQLGPRPQQPQQRRCSTSCTAPCCSYQAQYLPEHSLKEFHCQVIYCMQCIVGDPSGADCKHEMTVASRICRRGRRGGVRQHAYRNAHGFSNRSNELRPQSQPAQSAEAAPRGGVTEADKQNAGAYLSSFLPQ